MRLGASPIQGDCVAYLPEHPHGAIGVSGKDGKGAYGFCDFAHAIC